MGMSAASGIKSVQRGTATLTTGTVSVTIAAVNMAKAFVTFNNNYFGGSTSAPVQAWLSSATTLALGTSSDNNARTHYWEVVEFY